MDLLSQDEIDALLHGVDDGDVDTDDNSDEKGVGTYDLTTQDRIVRGRMPTLEMINERFARYTRISMFNLLRRTADVASGGINIQKYGEYFTTTSRWGNWTNNPCLYKKDFYLETVKQFAGEGIALEGNISKWWAKQTYKVAHGAGLFTHIDEGKHGR